MAAEFSDRGDLPEYQSVSPLAVLALLLGLASVLAFTAPLLSAIPVAAVGLALAAMASIKKSAGRLTGERLARWGLALALICGVAARAHHPVRDALLDRQAQDAIEQWVGLLANGRLEDSLERITPRRLTGLHPRTEPGQAPLPQAELHEHALDQLSKDPLVRRLKASSGDLRVEMVERAGPRASEGSRLVFQNIYRVHRTAAGLTETPLQLGVRFVHARGFEVSGT